MTERSCGILLPVFSLPHGYGVGDLGPGARFFVDFLEKSGQRLWQILPLNPTEPCYGNSPYHSISSFALSPLLISPDILVEQGLLQPGELPGKDSFPEHAAYEQAWEWKSRLFRMAHERFQARGDLDEFLVFCEEQSTWLRDFALFMALKARYGMRPWHEWPEEIRDRHPDSLASAEKDLEGEIDYIRFLQFVFFRQWQDLRAYCGGKGVQIIGDMPIYVVLDSADVWSSPRLFKLDKDRRPSAVAGVPPDYFSETGQRWGNPVYRWDVLREENYAWWLRRIGHNLRLVDMIRLDHFRGFVGYWEIPAEEKTAVNGKWVEAPARDFFSKVLQEFPRGSIIAEDLGYITPDVKAVLEDFQFPGMKVLLFAFGPDVAVNPYAPHNLERNCVVYTGTHDNNTARGWFDQETTPEDRERLEAYLGKRVSSETIAWDLVRLAMGSVAQTSLLSMVDVLGMGADHRINRPAVSNGNWKWRVPATSLTDELAENLMKLVQTFGR